MPTFYKEAELTQEQKSRIDRATDKYETLQVINANQYVSLLSIEEKQKIKRDNKLKTDEELQAYFLRLNSFHSPGEKSALFYRLLNGHRPLKYPPPTSFSYPWYDIVEKEEEQEVFEEHTNVQGFFYKGLDRNLTDIKDKMIIRQSVWEVVKVVSDTEALVTYPLWKALGFVWKLEFKLVPAARSSAKIACHHDRTIECISTLKQLREEQKYHIYQKVEELEKLLNVEKQSSYKKEIFEKYGVSFGKTLFESKLANAVIEIKDRQMKNLPDFPTKEEIEMSIESNVQKYLDKNYVVDQNGNLLVKTWVIRKISGDNKYLYME